LWVSHHQLTHAFALRLAAIRICLPLSLSLLQLSIATQQLQLLYSDQTEEVLAGQDFCDLLRNGHLALAAGQAPPPNSASECTAGLT
jgi:hypothetical protein